MERTCYAVAVSKDEFVELLLNTDLLKGLLENIPPLGTAFFGKSRLLYVYETDAKNREAYDVLSQIFLFCRRIEVVIKTEMRPITIVNRKTAPHEAEPSSVTDTGT